jgi:hypothetical protein
MGAARSEGTDGASEELKDSILLMRCVPLSAGRGATSLKKIISFYSYSDLSLLRNHI